MALTDNLISFWELEEASGTRSDSHGANHLTDNNTVTQTTGKVGSAAYFNSFNSEYLSIADNAALSTGDIDFTIAAWVLGETAAFDGSFNRTIAAKGTLNAGSGDEWALYFYIGPPKRFKFFTSNGSSFGVMSADTFGVPSEGIWIYLVAWHDSVANTVNIQANNGTVDSVSYSGGGHDGGSSFKLGWDGSNPYSYGGIDQVGFWKRVLTTQERTDLYNSGNGLSYAAMGGGDVLMPQILM